MSMNNRLSYFAKIRARSEALQSYTAKATGKAETGCILGTDNHMPFVPREASAAGPYEKNIEFASRNNRQFYTPQKSSLASAVSNVNVADAVASIQQGNTLGVSPYMLKEVNANWPAILVDCEGTEVWYYRNVAGDVAHPVGWTSNVGTVYSDFVLSSLVGATLYSSPWADATPRGTVLTFEEDEEVGQYGTFRDTNGRVWNFFIDEDIEAYLRGHAWKTTEDVPYSGLYTGAAFDPNLVNNIASSEILHGAEFTIISSKNCN